MYIQVGQTGLFRVSPNPFGSGRIENQPGLYTKPVLSGSTLPLATFG